MTRYVLWKESIFTISPLQSNTKIKLLSHLNFFDTPELLVVPEGTVQLTLVSEVVSLTEASPVHMGAERGAPLVTGTLLPTPRPPGALLTRHAVPGDGVTLVTRPTLTLTPAAQAPPPLAAPGLTSRPLVPWPTCTRAVSLKKYVFVNTLIFFVLFVAFPGCTQHH